MAPMLALFALLGTAILPALQQVGEPAVERGAPFLRVWRSPESGVHAQAFAITQDHRGRIFVGAGNGVSMFDGQRWRSLGLRSLACALATADDGHVYVGYSGGLGVVRDGADGPTVVPLFDGTALEGRLALVREIAVAADGIFCRDGSKLVRWRPASGQSFVWDAEPDDGEFTYVGRHGDRILVASMRRGLLQVNGDVLEPLPGTSALAGKRVRGVVVRSPERSLVFTFESGACCLEHGRLLPIDGLRQFVDNNRILGVTELADGRLIVASAAGAALIGAEDRLLSVLTRADGLPESEMGGRACVDGEGGAWLPMQGGVARVEWDVGVTMFDQRHGLEGGVCAIARHQGRLYVGSQRGLFAVGASADPARASRAQQLDGPRDTVWDLLSTGGRLLVAASNGLFEVGSTDVVRKLRSGAAHRFATTADGAVVVAVDRAICTLTLRGDDWVVDEIESPLRMATGVVVDGGGWWFVGFKDGFHWCVARVATDDATGHRVELFGDSEGVPATSLSLCRWRGSLLLGHDEGLLRYDQGQRKFVPDPQLGACIAAAGGGAANFGVDTSERLWFWLGAGRVGRATATATGVVLDEPLQRAGLENALRFLAEPDGALWVGSIDGRLLRYSEVPPRPTELPGVLVNAYAGRDGPATARSIAAAEPLPYAFNSIRFELALPRFDGTGNQFQTRLLGFTDRWSDWSPEAYRDFTDVAEGDYRFEVRGRDAHGRVTSAAALPFTVLPPWFRTAWAYALWVALAATAITSGMGWRSRRVRRRVDVLEREIAERQRVEAALRGSETRLRLEVQQHEQTAAERARLLDKLREVHRIEAAGVLASGLAHDFNNILTAILGEADIGLTMLRSNGQQRDELERSLEQIKRSGDRAAALTRQLLAYGRRQILKPQTLDPGAALEQLRPMLRRIVREDIELRFELAGDAGFVCVDPGQLEQVVVNLVVNAADAMPLGGTVTLRTTAADAFGEDGTPAVKITVTDTGTGIDAAILDRIFEPFFSTKPPGRGSGLGLASVQGIVHQSGGRVVVRTEPGRGSTFEVILPRVDGPGSNADPVPRSSPASPPVAATLLVCDDDAATLRVTRIVLERHGFVVLPASAPDAALVAARAHHGTIDLLISDVVMPGMNGLELAARLRAERPGLQVLFVSGHPADLIANHGVLDDSVELLTKPFTAEDLIVRVGKLLGGRRAAGDSR